MDDDLPVPKPRPIYFLVQRDPRTSLGVKKFYVAATTVTMAFCIITISGSFAEQDACATFENQSIVNFNNAAADLFYALIGFLAVWFIFSLVLCFQWKWMWMTQTFRPAPKYGQDVEDLQPGISSRSGSKLQVHSTALDNDIETEIERAYDDLDKIQDWKLK
jgi:hypothetical protein